MLMNLLDRLTQEQRLCELHREGLDGAPYELGFVLDYSDDLVLIRCVDASQCVDGFAVLRLRDISCLRWDTPALESWEEVHGEAARKVDPESDIDLSHWPAALTSIIEAYSVLSARREECEETCYRVAGVDFSDGPLVLEAMASEGFAGGQVAFSWHDLTRVTFGGRAEAASRAIYEAEDSEDDEG